MSVCVNSKRNDLSSEWKQVVNSNEPCNERCDAHQRETRHQSGCISAWTTNATEAHRNFEVERDNDVIANTDDDDNKVEIEDDDNLRPVMLSDDYVMRSW